MTFAAPGFLLAAFAVAAAAVALHLLVLRPPPASQLPTARFVPPAASLVRRRETWPQHRALLALRVATILVAGLAFAGPALSARRARGTRIIAFDSAATGAADSVAHYFRASDLKVPFNGSLSAALVGARRAAARLQEDSVELVIISPFATTAIDAATAVIRAQWPAAIRLVRAGLAPVPDRRAVVRWIAPSGEIDTVGAVIMDGVVAVAPFTRARSYHPPEGVIIARWVDGTPAAAERPAGDSCERDIAIGVPATREGDQVRAALTTRPCGPPPSAPMSDTALRAFAGTGAFGAKFGPNRNGGGDRTLMTSLLVLACALAIGEWLVRDRR